MTKQLLIGSLILLPAGLCAMFGPYHNLGTVESMREIVNNQVAEARAHAEMMARQIHAQKQMTLEIAAEQQAAQAAAQPAPQSGLVPRPTEAPVCVKDNNEGKENPIVQTRWYADRMEYEMRDGRTQIFYNWMLCGKGGAPVIVRYTGKPQFQPGTFRETPTRVLPYPNGTVDKFYADGRSELEDGFGTIVRFCKDGRKFKIRYDDDGECVILWEIK